jgi:hypothetical protein
MSPKNVVIVIVIASLLALFLFPKKMGTGPFGRTRHCLGLPWITFVNDLRVDFYCVGIVYGEYTHRYSP